MNFHDASFRAKDHNIQTKIIIPRSKGHTRWLCDPDIKTGQNQASRIKLAVSYFALINKSIKELNFCEMSVSCHFIISRGFQKGQMLQRFLEEAGVSPGKILIIHL